MSSQSSGPQVGGGDDVEVVVMCREVVVMWSGMNCYKGKLMTRGSTSLFAE